MKISAKSPRSAQIQLLAAKLWADAESRGHQKISERKNLQPLVAVEACREPCPPPPCTQAH